MIQAGEELQPVPFSHRGGLPKAGLSSIVSLVADTSKSVKTKISSDGVPDRNSSFLLVFN